MQMTVLSRFRSVKCHFVITLLMEFWNIVNKFCTFAMATSLISRIAVAITKAPSLQSWRVLTNIP